jgi:hypothetical protein
MGLHIDRVAKWTADDDEREDDGDETHGVTSMPELP